MIIDYIKKRRTNRKFDEKIDDKTLLETLSIAYKYTPNHQKRYPYRFEVINNKEQFINLINKIRDNDIKIPPYLKMINDEYIQNGFLPTFVVVIAPKDNVEKKFNEDILANGALIQNIHLILVEKGYSLCWKTYFINKDFPYIYGINKNEIVTGFLIIGKPSDEVEKRNYNEIKVNIKGL